MEFALFATLPLALFSLLHRSTKAHAGLGFLAALAPVIGSAVSGIFGRKSQQSQQQAQIDYQRQLAEQQEAQRRAAFEAYQSSPQAAVQRLGFNTRLAALLGQFGGRGQTPQFILNAFDVARQPQEYTPGAGFVAPPKTGGSFWDYAGDLANAASYFDVGRYNRGRQGAGAAPMTMPSGPGSAIDPSVIGGMPSTGGTAASAAGLLPSAIRGRQYFNLGRTPAAEEFLKQRRTIPGG